MRRRGAVLVAAIVAFVPSPAQAHTRAGAATDWASRISDAPQVPGVTWRLYPTAEYVSLENTGDDNVIVLGYEGEPYLRIGPKGVERNLHSPATYLNARRDADVALPPNADPSAAPEWMRLSEDRRYVWYDHRVHRMPQGEPDAGPWSLPFVVEGRRYALRGELTLDPGPPWWQPLAFGFLATAVALAGIRRTGLARIRPAAIVVGAVALVNLVHLPDEVLALPSAAIDTAYRLLHNLLFIGVGVGTAFLVARGKTRSRAMLLLGSGGVALHQGFLQVGQLGASQIPTIWPEAVIRAAVGMSVAQLVYVLIVLATPQRTEAREDAQERRAIVGMDPEAA